MDTNKIFSDFKKLGVKQSIVLINIFGMTITSSTTYNNTDNTYYLFLGEMDNNGRFVYDIQLNFNDKILIQHFMINKDDFNFYYDQLINMINKGYR